MPAMDCKTASDWLAHRSGTSGKHAEVCGMRRPLDLGAYAPVAMSLVACNIWLGFLRFAAEMAETAGRGRSSQ